MKTLIIRETPDGELVHDIEDEDAFSQIDGDEQFKSEQKIKVVKLITPEEEKQITEAGEPGKRFIQGAKSGFSAGALGADQSGAANTVGQMVGAGARDLIIKGIVTGLLKVPPKIADVGVDVVMGGVEGGIQEGSKGILPGAGLGAAGNLLGEGASAVLGKVTGPVGKEMSALLSKLLGDRKIKGSDALKTLKQTDDELAELVKDLPTEDSLNAAKKSTRDAEARGKEAAVRARPPVSKLDELDNLLLDADEQLASALHKAQSSAGKVSEEALAAVEDAVADIKANRELLDQLQSKADSGALRQAEKAAVERQIKALTDSLQADAQKVVDDLGRLVGKTIPSTLVTTGTRRVGLDALADPRLKGKPLKDVSPGEMWDAATRAWREITRDDKSAEVEEALRIMENPSRDEDNRKKIQKAGLINKLKNLRASGDTNSPEYKRALAALELIESPKPTTDDFGL